MNRKKLIVSMLVLVSLSVFAGEVKPESWDLTKGWKIEGRTMVAEKWAGELFQIERKNYRIVEISADITPIKAESSSWNVCGLAIYKSKDQFWQLGFVEMPDSAGKRHYLELKEQSNGVWGNEKKLRKIKEKLNASWRYGVTYKAIILLSEDKIEGVVKDGEGKIIAEFGYVLNHGDITEGAPALRQANMMCEFNNINIEKTE